MMMMMMMEEVVQEDHQNQVLGSKEISQIIKGKRTKRQRPFSPLDLTMAVSTSSAEAITSNYSSPTTSTNYGFTEISSSTTTNTEEEEEDMANCLILLAQGHLTPREKPNTQKVLFQSEKPAENNISAIGNHNKSGGALTSTGLFAYQCKTCDRCFSSFQALGGHRASHKKPKVNPNGNNNKKSLLSFIEQENIIGHHNFDNQNSTSTDLSLQISNRNIGLNNNSTIANNKTKVHECSICGAEFTSGQALGGHMRRHRSFINTTQTTAMGTTTTTTTTTSLSLVSSSLESRELKKSRNVLQLDLNLPAPEDDRRESKFPFAGKEQVIVFSHASPLVDCHYS